mmetsp:Transcript_652/g.1549  ORF Transcript_652/g.1549 Transcript_652/m.1549 type:complete len:181 (-) Transcript_652:860-1402(-)
MRYISTRTGERYSFQEAVQLGRATDGGMLLPETVPFVARATLQGWSHLSYPELGLKIFKLFVPASEFPHSTLEEIFLKGAFSEFGASDVVTLRDTELAVDSKTPLVHVAELWHGPTLAFKDLGMQVLAKVATPGSNLEQTDLSVFSFCPQVSGIRSPRSLHRSPHDPPHPRYEVIIVFSS